MPDTPESAPRSETILGFDYGEARTGVAVAQIPPGLVSPLCVLKCRAGVTDWRAIQSLVSEWRPSTLVVGVPHHLDGSESEMTRAARRFGRRLAQHTGIPVEETDERLTSHQAQSELTERRRSGTGKRGQAERIDAIAARILLEQWLLERGKG